MPLHVVGAGFGRTGTHSLKLALEKLLGAPCYHMVEVFAHTDHVPPRPQASLGNMPDWGKLFDGYASGVDFPVANFWPEISRAFPDALVLLSVRDPEEWCKSAQETILSDHAAPHITEEWRAMIQAIFKRQWNGKPPDRE